MRRLKPALVSILAAALLLFGSIVSAEELRQDFSQRYELAPGASVSLKNTNGSIVVSSWAENDVLVEATKVIKTLGRSRAEDAMRDLRIEISRPSGDLEIRTRHPQSASGISGWLFGRHVTARVSYRVKVPKGTAVRATTVNGNIGMEAIDGEIVVETTNGKILITEARGKAKVSTTNGSIRAEFTHLAAGADMSFRTTNGSITVYLPKDLPCTVNASTVNGAVSTDFAVPIKSHGHRGHKRLQADINGGGGELTMRTVNGSIQLRKK